MLVDGGPDLRRFIALPAVGEMRDPRLLRWTPRRRSASVRALNTLRSLVAADALHFWLQGHDLPKAENIPAPNGLELEGADLKSGDGRATVVSPLCEMGEKQFELIPL